MLTSLPTLNFWYNILHGVAKSHKNDLGEAKYKILLYYNEQDKHKVSLTKNDRENKRKRISCFERKIASRISSKNFLHTSLYRPYPPSLPVTRYSFVLLLRLRFFSRNLRKVAQFVLLLFDVEAVSELASFFSTKTSDAGINEEKWRLFQYRDVNGFRYISNWIHW